jgi:YidC/Oxa1 family membrane protein insertase
MDRKAYIVLLISFLLLMVWYPVINHFYPPTPSRATTNSVSKVIESTATNYSNSIPTISAQTNAAATNVNTLPRIVTQPNAPEDTLTIENKDVRYTFSSHGGGLKFVELKTYPAVVQCNPKIRGATNSLATLNTKAPLPVLAILDGLEIEADRIFAISKTETSVRAEKLLTNGLYLVKEFQLSTNYLLKASVRLENRTAQSILLPEQEWVIGTATPISPHDETMMLGVQWYNGRKDQVVNEPYFANRTLGCFPGSPRSEYRGGESNVVWASVYNQFFALVAVPNEPAPQVVARRVNLPPPAAEQLASDSRALAHPFGYQAGFLYPGGTLAGGQSVERRFDIYAGPKEYNTLARLGNNLDLVMQFGAFVGFFAKLLLLSMNALYATLHVSYGVAIIIITVIIKLAFWPLTKASTKSMKRMAALQPQMKALQEKYKDDPKKMNLKLMEFMKEHKVSPLGGCLPMLLQIPVFIGFYTMLRSAIELRGAKFLWACDLSQADTILILPGIGFPLNPMPLLMGVTMLWQAKLTPPAPGMDPVQQKIMRYMPLMFIVFLYNMSAGLTLYWTVQNLLTIVQMKLTKTSESQTAQGPVPPPGLSPKPKKKQP